ncbi:hypothetical protein C2G38_2184537 [Gigaspora rosea]|uniref:Protein kinase domain-containing protein n=1 Tax=Gigaspora rosea TaxID=44941 RepID=A0A397V7L2_9GLOM|nr:hypothetical protein C2G38_2184537 [Gigaspora rosea]
MANKFEEEFYNWTSDNQDIDQLLMETQRGFGTIFKAIWMDGYTTSGYVTGLVKKNEWKRSSQIKIKNQHKYGGNSAIAIYGITKNPRDGNNMMVMEYAEQGILTLLIFGLCKPISQSSNSKELFVIMSEVFTGYQPYHNISHNKDLEIKICLGLPKIRCEIPQLLLDLMNKCLDAEPQNRPTAEELANRLNQFFNDLK